LWTERKKSDLKREQKLNRVAIAKLSDVAGRDIQKVKGRGIQLAKEDAQTLIITMPMRHTYRRAPAKITATDIHQILSIQLGVNPDSMEVKRRGIGEDVQTFVVAMPKRYTGRRAPARIITYEILLALSLGLGVDQEKIAVKRPGIEASVTGN
jgi:hypothetical protein